VKCAESLSAVAAAASFEPQADDDTLQLLQSRVIKLKDVSQTCLCRDRIVVFHVSLGWPGTETVQVTPLRRTLASSP